ncbi:MAG: hypothetical protein CL949_17635 [Erythrobacter sp.]|nr:hypothetical protein [Erythrobacter sp.]
METDDGRAIAIGATESEPTVGIVDYSRRETDDFGVTTVVPRDFARTMSVRVKVPSENVDQIQRDLASLRAKAALWVADDRFESLSFRGYFKEFSIDLAIPPVSFCTLTIEGLVEGGDFHDPGGDPAPANAVSSLRLLQPVTNIALRSSSVDEDDYPLWDDDANYDLGARVIRMHRIFESAADNNQGNEPIAAAGLWIDIGATNRWAMFDQALGSATEAAEAITVTLVALDPINAVALLDVTAHSVRVQAEGYDRTLSPTATPGMVAFLDLPDVIEAFTVTITGPGAVSVGTLLFGQLVGLGITEASPTAGITDYSRKETDDFGEVTVVERAWAKRMNVRALIATDALDVVAGRIARVRAIPSLWIGDEGRESVTIYGFFKDFSIAVGQNVSTLSLSVEGLSAAAKIAPLQVDPGDVSWGDIVDDDPAHPKPQDGATVGAPDGTAVGGTTASNVIAALLALGSVTDPDDIVGGALALIDRTKNHALALFEAQMLGEERKARWERLTHLDGKEITTRVRSEISERIDGDIAIVEMVNEIEAAATDGVAAAMAAISDEASVRASADAAETAQRELAVSLVQAHIDDAVIDLQAAILDEATTRADADSAETMQRELAISQLRSDVDGEIVDVMAAIGSEASTRATADEAEASAREALAASIASDLADVNAAIINEASVRASGDEAEATAREALAATLSGDIADVSAAVESEAIARAAEDGAIASDLSAVQTTVDGNTASVLMLMESVDGLSAQWGVRIVREGPGGAPVVSGVRLNDNGEESDFTVMADKFRVYSDSSGDRYEFGDGRQVIVGGSVMTISGRPFGSTDQFLEWTGPVVSDLSQCTEANAIKYVDVSGNARFNGSLSSGILKNEGTSTTVSPSAFIVVGPFQSMGAPINVNMSASFTREQTADAGTASISGAGGGTLALEWSSDGDNWTLLTTIGANETERLVVVDGDPTVRDTIKWTMAAAGTFAWTPGALSGVLIRLRWTAFSQPTINGTNMTFPVQTQRTSVIAVEQP